MKNKIEPQPISTKNHQYADRLISLQSTWWKEKFFFLNPYLVHVRIITRGRVLEVGSGIGRNLRVLRQGSLGVDHNKFAVEYARKKKLSSLTVNDFFTKSRKVRSVFDTLLLSHVLEHVDSETQEQIFDQFIPFLASGAKIVLICPQEAGFVTDKTHIRWVNESMLRDILESLGCRAIKVKSFPFPRRAGKKFKYNQTVATGFLL